MPQYVVLDENGRFVALVPHADLAPILAKAGRPTTLATVPMDHSTARTVAQRPAAAARPVAAPPKAGPGQTLIYKIRHIPSGRFLAAGLKLDSKKPPNLWATEGHAKAAIASAVNKGVGARSEYEIVPAVVDAE